MSRAPGIVPATPPQDSDITRLLDRWCDGDRDAFDALMPLVYDELRKVADGYLRGERQGHTLQPTALVHEAFLRLRNVRDLRMENRAYFYGAAAQTMRRVLVDHARRRRAGKRGGNLSNVALTTGFDQPIDTRLDIIALNDALEALEGIAPEKAKVIELRFFGGLTVDETAAFLGIAPATVKRHFAFARAWLVRALDGSHAPDDRNG